LEHKGKINNKKNQNKTKQPTKPTTKTKQTKQPTKKNKKTKGGKSKAAFRALSWWLNLLSSAAPP
jgi:hypothetical protein